MTLRSPGPRAVGCLIAAALLAACGTQDKTGTGSAGARVLHVELTDAGCRPAALTVPSGPVTFEVTNDAAEGVTEYEVLDSSGRILGEKEDLAPGLSGSFSLVLSPGRYTLRCPGGTSAARGTLTVTGS